VQGASRGLFSQVEGLNCSISGDGNNRMHMAVGAVPNNRDAGNMQLTNKLSSLKKMSGHAQQLHCNGAAEHQASNHTLLPQHRAQPENLK
jgi:hypothetical protein